MPLEQDDTPHTPGPWHFDGCVQIVEAERPHMRVAFLPSDHHEYAASPANGRLIAAAPDLLVALLAMVDRWEPDADGGQDRIMWENACAAIAKARGYERDEGDPRTPEFGVAGEFKS